MRKFLRIAFVLFSVCRTNSALGQDIGKEAEEAIKWIESVGGAWVRYDAQVDPPRPAFYSVSLPKVTDKDLKMLVGLRNVQSVDLGDPRITDKGLEELWPLKEDLIYLSVGRTAVTGAGLSGLSNLSIVRLDYCPVTDADLANFKELKKLGYLSLQGTKVSGSPPFGHLSRSLDSIDLSETAISDAGLKALTGFPKLGVLKLNKTGITDEGLKELARPANLGASELNLLELDETQITGVGFKELRDLKNLTAVHLAKSRCTDAALEHLSQNPHLAFLDLSHTKVTDAGMKHLAACRQMFRLKITGTKITHQGLKDFGPMPRLRMLEMGQMPVSEDMLKELARLPRLTKLDLEGAKPITLKGVTGLKLVFELKLQNSAVTDAGLKEIAGMAKIPQVNLSNTAVTDAGLKELGGMKRIRYLNLSNTSVTNAGMKHLGGVEMLGVLDLSNTRISGAGLKELAAQKRAFSSLILASTDVTDDGLKELNCHVSELDLSGCKITDAAVLNMDQRLLDGFSKLKLSNTQITNACLPHLAKCKRLMELDVTKTKVTREAVRILRDNCLPGCRMSVSE